MDDQEYRQSAQASAQATSNGAHPLEVTNRGDQHSRHPDPTNSAGASSDGIYEPESDDIQSDEEGIEDNFEPLDAESGRSSRAGSHEVSSNQGERRGPDAPQLSKMARKRQDQAQRGIELDDVGTRKGTIRYVARPAFGSQLEYLHNGTWVKAVYHYRIRGKLLRITDAQGQYEETPDSGASVNDRTAFKAEQKDLEFLDRKHRPEVLFQWEGTNQGPSYGPELMYDNERIVLSFPENHPVKAWRELPLTLSGQCEGLRMEFYRRLNEAITMRDLRARMPKMTSKGERLIVLENSTRCWRDLNDAEVAYVDQGNKGAEFNLKKAGRRMLTPEERQKRVQKEQDRAMNTKKKIGQTITIHPVFEEALSQAVRVPRLGHVDSYHSSVLDAPSPSRAPSQIKDRREEEQEEQRLGPTLPEPGDQGVRKDTDDYEDDGPRKKGKHDPARPIDLSNYPIGQVPRSILMHTGNLRPNHQILGRGGFDYRYQRPASEAEQRKVDEALQITRDNYQFDYGLPPLSPTSTAESYFHQLSELQAESDARWPLQTRPPALDYFTSPWYGSFDAWRSHHLATQRFQRVNPNHRASGGISDRGPSENLEGETLLEK
ncbi:MAG: hypothetical protein Q9182_001812 [Xanthomendoza sp. 2 TL-2023]